MKNNPRNVGRFTLEFTTSIDGNIPLCHLHFNMWYDVVEKAVKKYCGWSPTTDVKDFPIKFYIFSPKDIEHIMRKFGYNKKNRKHARFLFETYIKEFEYERDK